MMNMHLEFRDVEYISAIAKYNSVTAAAESLNITQPALSIYINRLEERLGVKLFNRFGKRFQLAYAGQIILDEGQKILFLQKNIEARLMNVKEFQEGRILLGIPFMRGISFLPKLMKEFQIHYPNISIELVEMDYATDAEDLLLNGEIDIAFFNQIRYIEGIEYHKIGQETMVLVASREFPLLQQAKQRDGFLYPWIDLNLCRPYSFIQSAPKQITAHLTDRIFADYHFTPNYAGIVRNQLTAIMLATKGDSLFIAPDYLTFQGLLCEKPSIVSIGQERPYEIDFVAATRKGYRFQPVEHLIETARAQYGRQLQR